MIKNLVSFVGMAIIALLWINQEQRGILTPPTTGEVLIAAAIMPDEIVVPMPAAQKTSWPATTRYTIADSPSAKCHIRYGN